MVMKLFPAIFVSRFAVLMAAVCLIVNVGCDHKPAQRPGTAIVLGSVKLKDQPVKGGSLTFISQSDPNDTASCKIGHDGNFAIADAPLGDAKVTVDTETIKGYLGDRYVKVPTKYWQPGTTDLTVKIQEGENKVELKLE